MIVATKIVGFRKFVSAMVPIKKPKISIKGTLSDKLRCGKVYSFFK